MFALVKYLNLNTPQVFDVTLTSNATNQLIKILFALGYKKVKHFKLLKIAFLVTGILNLFRVLIYFDVTEPINPGFTDATIADIIARSLFHLLFAWVILLFNARLRFAYENWPNWLRSVLTFCFNTILFFLLPALFFYIYNRVSGQVISEQEQGLEYFVAFVVMLVLIFVAGVLRYQIIHQQDLVDKESLKREKLSSELDALRNQINPHFLFNSLNTLNSLTIGNEKATTFVNKLSFMYRYILQSGQDDLVTIDEELKFLKSYLFLIKTRYRDNFKSEITIDQSIKSHTIPPLAIQLLVENAVKHNEISARKPLLVKVYSEDNHLVVENDIVPRSTFVDSTGNGLVNLNKRYQLLKDKRIIILNSDEKFIVKLPLN